MMRRLFFRCAMLSFAVANNMATDPPFAGVSDRVIMK